jgi:GT2 family glycosyltransferase
LTVLKNRWFLRLLSAVQPSSDQREETALGKVSIVVVTRNRPASARQAVASILACDHEEFELVVVDQGDIPLELPVDPKLRLLRSGPGLCRGRNRGISSACSDLIGCTDDDCLVPREWVSRVAEALESDRVGLVFGNACAGDPGEGVIPAHLNNEARHARSPWQRNRIEGMGACMALRRSVWAELGGFDESLGAGSFLKAGDETDFAIRALIAGWEVRTDPRLELVHLGERQLHELADLTSSYWCGTGAVFAKFLRMRPGPAIFSLTGLGVRWLRGGGSHVALSTGAGRSARLTSFLHGFRLGLTTPLQGSCFATPHGYKRPVTPRV